MVAAANPARYGQRVGEVGHIVIGPAGDMDAALVLLAKEGANVALVDVSLAGAPVGLKLAEMLEAQRIPFAFLTGYSASLFPVGLRHRPRLEKPFGRDQLLSIVDQLGAEGRRKPMTPFYLAISDPTFGECALTAELG